MKFSTLTSKLVQRPLHRGFCQVRVAVLKSPPAVLRPMVEEFIELSNVDLGGITRTLVYNILRWLPFSICTPEVPLRIDRREKIHHSLQMIRMLYQDKFRQHPELQQDYEANVIRLSFISLDESFPTSRIPERVEESR